MRSTALATLATLALVLALAALLAEREPPVGLRQSPPSPPGASLAATSLEGPETTELRIHLATRFGADGGVGTADAAAPEPEPATGILAGALTRLLCPRAARVLCAARRRYGCGAPTEGDATCEETTEADCGAWAERHYGWVQDAYVVDDASLAFCLRALEHDAGRGASIDLDLSCQELARDTARVGEPCAHEFAGCGDDGFCMGGRCRAATTLGEPCDEVDCARDLVCIAGLCTRATPRGGVCDPESVCAERGDECLAGRCAPFDPGGVEAPDGRCRSDAECDVGRQCVGDDYRGTCAAAPQRGRPCLADAECEPLSCSEAGRCEEPAPTAGGALREGEACEIASTTPGCRADLRCAYGGALGYVCVRLAGLGEDCELTGCREGTCTWGYADGHCEPELCESALFRSEDEE